MRILFATLASVMEGPPRSLIQMLKLLDRKQFTPIVLLTPSTCDEFRSEVAALNLEKIEFPSELQNWMASPDQVRQWRRSPYHWIREPGRVVKSGLRAFRIAKIIHRRKIDLLYSNLELSPDVALAAFIGRRPHVWHVRAEIGDRAIVAHLLGDRFVCRCIRHLSNLVIANSLHTMKRLSQHIQPDKLRLIYNGVELIPATKGRLRRQFAIQNNQPLVGVVASLVPHKGIDNFLKAANVIHRSYPQTRFCIIGRAFEEPLTDFANSIRTQVHELGLTDCVIFAGYQKDAAQLIADFSLLIQPMINGSWGRPVLEAMAAGIPVIGCEGSGESEIIANQITGVVVNNPSELGPAALRLLADPELRHRYGKAGQQLIMNRFSLTSHVNLMQRVFYELGANGHMPERKQ
jgi:glycosyltransferase involved in cell wall biosynthesis